jgi:CRP-like cAMP-binding protein
MNTFVEPSGKLPSPPPTSGDGRNMQNDILLKLPATEANILLPNLEFVRLKVHQILHEPGESIQWAYFLDSGLLSVVNLQPNGKTVEVALIGKGGFAGLPIIDGFRSSPTRVVAQADGTAHRIESQNLAQVLTRCPILARELHRYGQRLAMQTMHIAACNRLHEVDERLARWLLMSYDLLGSNELPLTQELLGQMLGTRRSSVSMAAGELHKAGIITYVRGNVTVLDKKRLEELACDCYGAIGNQQRKWETETADS